MLDITFEETRVYREIKAEAEQKGLEQGRQEGRQEEAASLIRRMLTKRFGLLSGEVQGSVTALSIENLEALSEALLDFDNLGELSAWIGQRTQ
jgi:predicted transposase YdaD